MNLPDLSRRLRLPDLTVPVAAGRERLLFKGSVAGTDIRPVPGGGCHDIRPPEAARYVEGGYAVRVDGLAVLLALARQVGVAGITIREGARNGLAAAAKTAGITSRRE